MLIIAISLYPGRTKEQKDAFARAITDAAIQILKTKPEHIIVTYDEKPKEKLVYGRKSTMIRVENQ